MKRKLLILFCTALWGIGFAQNHKEIDSLTRALNRATTDSAKFSLHFKIYREYVEFNNDSALHHVEKQISIAAQNNMNLAQADALETKGYVFQKFGKYAESFQTLNQATNVANMSSNEGRNWFPDSLGTSYEIRKRILGYIQLDLGHVMASTNNTESQIAHYLEAIKLAKEIRAYELLGLASMNLGSVYLWTLNKLDSAILFQRLAISSFEKANHKKWLNAAYGALGDVYSRKKESKLAVENYHKAIKSAYEVNNIENVFWSTYSLSDHYIKEQIKDSSLYYALKLGDLLRMHSAALPENADEQYYILLSRSYMINNQSDSAYEYLKRAYSLKDSSYQTQIKDLTDVQNLVFEEKIRAEKLEKEKTILQNRVRQYSLLGGLGLVLLVALLLLRNNRQKQKTNKVLETTLTNLKSTQAQLIQSEKMASLGELTAGIAHEIQNPLNFVNNFSELNKELSSELKTELSTGNMQSAIVLANDINENSEKINHHGKRAESIVKGMLQHSRKSTGIKEPTDINKLCDEYMRLSYQGLRAKDKSFSKGMPLANCDYRLDLDPDLPKINAVTQDLGRVLLNIINNAFQACAEKQKKSIEDYKPLVILTSSSKNDKVNIRISDNGYGIPDKIKDKIFQPFFTTKPTGEGTGLGLSLAYDIVKVHGGNIMMESKEGEGSTFIVELPLNISSI